MTHNKELKTPGFLKRNVDYTGAVTKGQQTSDNIHKPTLRRHEKTTT
jgi:hypothetical protein